MVNFIKFAVVGSLGTITNLILFFIMADQNNISTTIASIIGFTIAGTQNYILNHLWTFKKLTENIKPSIKKGWTFLVCSLLGFGINLLVLHGLLYLFELPFKTIAQAIGILAGMSVNYYISKNVVFANNSKLLKEENNEKNT